MPRARRERQASFPRRRINPDHPVQPSRKNSAHRRMLRGHTLKLNEDPHRRFNPLTNEWVLVSPHRATRPWQGEVAQLPTTKEPAYDPSCYLCPGNTRAGGIHNPAYANTFVFDNDF